MKLRASRIPRVVTASVLVLLPASAMADDWPLYQHDTAHTGLSSASFNPHALDRAWEAPQNYAVPLVVGDTAYAMASGYGTSDPTHIASFDLNTGAVHWQTTDEYTFPSAISVAGGLVVYTAEDSSFNSSLYVRDAATGAIKYSISGDSTFNAPTLVTDPSGGVTAYVATGNRVTAYSLGQTSGSMLWSKTGSFGGDSIPTVVGNSLIVAGPFHYYALDRATGTMNQFQNGGGSGGGGNTVAYDASRHQFYVEEDYGGSVGTAITAYSYTDNSHITRLWQHTGTGVATGNSVALGPDGKIYAADKTTLVELDPSTGNILRSLPSQQFANGNAPILSNGYLWEFTGNIFPAHTSVYDLNTFTQAATLPDSRGDLNTPFKSIGTLVDDHFLQTYGRIDGQPGFVVYTALPGDLDHNGHVDFQDLLALAQNYGQAGAYEQGDISGDGQVNFNDLLTLAQHYGQSIPPPASGAVAAVPEPTCLAALLATAALTRRRRNLRLH